MSTWKQILGRLQLTLRRTSHIVGWHMTPTEVIAFFKGQPKKVLTFYGYSGMGYEDEAAMLGIAQTVLAGYSPESTLVNIGATSSGIGAVYPLAKSLGFETTGIVTYLALKRPHSLSPAVDHICFVIDQRWGGKLPNSNELSPTSTAMVACSDILVGIGGGSITRDEMLAGKAQGNPTYFYSADMNHAQAVRHANQLGLPQPAAFNSAADELLRE